MSAPVMVTVLYPASQDLVFDMDYYLETHMPFVEGLLKPFGLQQAFAVDLRGTDSPYAVQAIMVFGTGVEGLQKGMQAHGEEITADVAKFTNAKATRLIGGVKYPAPAV